MWNKTKKISRAKKISSVEHNGKEGKNWGKRGKFKLEYVVNNPQNATVPELYHRRKQIPAFHHDVGSMPDW